MTKDYFITDKDKLFFWFSIIENTGAKQVLDMGLFLERIGAIARQVGDIMIPVNIELDGLNMSTEKPLPIYETIYDHIIEVQDEIKGHYDLAILLASPDEWNSDDIGEIIRSGKISMLAVDMPAYEMLRKMDIDLSKVRDVRTDDREYKLISF